MDEGSIYRPDSSLPIPLRHLLKRRPRYRPSYVQSWQQDAALADRPSSFSDFLIAHNVCPDCGGLGLKETKTKLEGVEISLIGTCLSCNGKGVFKGHN